MGWQPAGRTVSSEQRHRKVHASYVPLVVALGLLFVLTCPQQRSAVSGSAGKLHAIGADSQQQSKRVSAHPSEQAPTPPPGSIRVIHDISWFGHAWKHSTEHPTWQERECSFKGHELDCWFISSADVSNGTFGPDLRATAVMSHACRAPPVRFEHDPVHVSFSMESEANIQCLNAYNAHLEFSYRSCAQVSMGLQATWQVVRAIAHWSPWHHSRDVSEQYDCVLDCGRCGCRTGLGAKTCTARCKLGCALQLCHCRRSTMQSRTSTAIAARKAIGI